MITGWTISSAVFDPITDLYVPPLRVISYDHRGTGRSGAWLGPVSIAMLAADAARVLDDRGLRSAHVLAFRWARRSHSSSLCGCPTGSRASSSLGADRAGSRWRCRPGPRLRDWSARLSGTVPSTGVSGRRSASSPRSSNARSLSRSPRSPNPSRYAAPRLGPPIGKQCGALLRSRWRSGSRPGAHTRYPRWR